MRPRNIFNASSFLLAICATLVCSASLLAKGPTKGATTADLLLVPDTPPCPELMEVTGLYQDGLGTYKASWATRVNLHVQPACSDNRNFFLLLPVEARDLLTPGEWASCAGFSNNTPLLRIPALLDAQTGVVGQDAGFNGVKYAFHIDSDGDGWYETPANIYWHDGIHLTRTELTNPNRTVYSLTTGPTSDYAEVRSDGASLGTFCIPLRLTVTRMK
ncbi:MAG: hypothetical protein WEF99_18350 [Thermoanaerobaculia bacterium]